MEDDDYHKLCQALRENGNLILFPTILVILARQDMMSSTLKGGSTTSDGYLKKSQLKVSTLVI